MCATSIERVVTVQKAHDGFIGLDASIGFLQVNVVRVVVRQSRVPLEVICLFRGRILVRTPTEAILLQPGDGLTVLAGLTHQFENVGSEDAEMSLSYSSGDRRYVAE
jgi:hypothetical protein